MNQAASSPNLSFKTTSEIFQAAKFCRDVFVKEQLNHLETSIDQLASLAESGLSKSPLLTLACLNLRHSKCDYFINLLAKTAITTATFARQMAVEPDSSRILIKTNLLILFGIAKPLLLVKRRPELWSNYKTLIERAPLIAFKRLKNTQIKEQECLRLLSQLAGMNQITSTEQTCRAIASIAVNGVLHTIPFKSVNCVSMETGLDRCLQGQAIIKMQAGAVQRGVAIKRAMQDILNCGQLIRLKDGQFAIYLGALKESKNNKCLVLGFNNNKLDSNVSIIKTEQSSLIYRVPQPPLDFSIFMQGLREHNDVINQNLSLPLKFSCSNLRGQLLAPAGMEERSKILLNGDERQIIELLQTDTNVSGFLLDYASKGNRQKQAVKDVRHAIALLGHARLYPVIGDSQLSANLYSNRYLGASRIQTASSLFAELCYFQAKRVGLSTPEFAPFIARLLFAAFILIPKAKFAVTSTHKIKLDNNINLASLYLGATGKGLEQWLKLTLQLSTQWRLPKAYVAALKGYFDYIAGQVELKALPKPSRTLVALLDIATWSYARLSTERSDSPFPQPARASLTALDLTALHCEKLLIEFIENVHPYSRLD